MLNIWLYSRHSLRLKGIYPLIKEFSIDLKMRRDLSTYNLYKYNELSCVCLPLCLPLPFVDEGEHRLNCL